MQNRYKSEAEDIDRQLAEDYEAKCRIYENRIAELEKALSEKNQLQPQAEEVA